MCDLRWNYIRTLCRILCFILTASLTQALLENDTLGQFIIAIAIGFFGYIGWFKD